MKKRIVIVFIVWFGLAMYLAAYPTSFRLDSQGGAPLDKQREMIGQRDIPVDPSRSINEIEIIIEQYDYQKKMDDYGRHPISEFLGRATAYLLDPRAILPTFILVFCFFMLPIYLSNYSNERRIGDKEGKNDKIDFDSIPSSNDFETIIEKGANVNARDEKGRTALMHAAELNDVEILEYLITAGADPALRDKKGIIAAHLADKHKPEILKSEAYWQLHDARFD